MTFSLLGKLLESSQRSQLLMLQQQIIDGCDDQLSVKICPPEDRPGAPRVSASPYLEISHADYEPTETMRLYLTSEHKWLEPSSSAIYDDRDPAKLKLLLGKVRSYF